MLLLRLLPRARAGGGWRHRQLLLLQLGSSSEAGDKEQAGPQHLVVDPAQATQGRDGTKIHTNDTIRCGFHQCWSIVRAVIRK